MCCQSRHNTAQLEFGCPVPYPCCIVDGVDTRCDVLLVGVDDLQAHITPAT
jgi:hypothetical protein